MTFSGSNEWNIPCGIFEKGRKNKMQQFKILSLKLTSFPFIKNGNSNILPMKLAYNFSAFTKSISSNPLKKKNNHKMIVTMYHFKLLKKTSF